MQIVLVAKALRNCGCERCLEVSASSVEGLLPMRAFNGPVEDGPFGGPSEVSASDHGSIADLIAQTHPNVAVLEDPGEISLPTSALFESGT